jgi:hypothetical protein
MLYKPDFEDIIPRMEAWWHGDLLDRSCIAIIAPNGKPRRTVPEPATPFERRTDPDYLFDAAEAWMETTYFAGEAVPAFYPDLGADVFSACLGAPLEYSEHTTWAKQTIADWDHPPPFQIDRDSFAWKWHHDIYRVAAKRAEGKYFLGAPDCHSGGDCLLAMRGGSNLCLDLYDHAPAVQAAMSQLEKSVVQFHDEWWPLIEATGQRGHTTSWLNTWSPGRSNVIQLDLLAMISPAQFARFFSRELEVQMQALDNTVYHLDGPDAIPHLPALHSLFGHTPARSAGADHDPVIPIQWVPGAGAAPMAGWIPLLKQIQAQGANLHLWCQPDEVEPLMTELSSRGLFLSTWSAGEEEAEELIKLVARLTHE